MWNNCPKDLLTEVLKQLPISNLLNLKLVCKNWSKNSDSEELFHYLCVRDWDVLHLDNAATWKDMYKDLYTFKVLIVSGEFPESKIKLTDVYEKITSGGIRPKQARLINLIDNDDSAHFKSCLHQYNSVFFWSNQSTFRAPFDAATVGDLLSDFVASGGGVVIGVFTTAGYGLRGRWTTESRDPIQTVSQTELKNAKMVPKIPDHPILRNVDSFVGGTGCYCSRGDILNNSKVIATWDTVDNIALIVESVKDKVVALNFYPPSSNARSDFWDETSDGGKIMANALRFVRGHCKSKRKSKNANNL